MDEISGTAQQNYKHCLDMCGKLDATLTEKIEAQDERLDDLSSTVEENRAAATAATEALDSKFTDDNKRRDLATEAKHEHFSGMLVALENTLGEEK
eukprot:COSAG04_NODE_27234_length_285_cov_0.838710_1_plen_95_part_11